MRPLHSQFVTGAAVVLISALGACDGKSGVPPKTSESQDAIVARHLATFDTMDLGVFNRREWTRLSDSHSEDIVVTFDDGTETRGLARHLEDIKGLVAFAPDVQVLEHSVRFGNGPWTTVMGELGGTFTKPLRSPGGQAIAPTGKHFHVPMVTVAHWNPAGRMDHEWVFLDDLLFRQQLGLSK